MNWNAPEISLLVRSALREDSAHSDITSRHLIDPSARVEAVIVSKATGIVAGLPLAAKFFRTFDPHVRFRATVRDGKRVHSGERLALIKGSGRSILSAERPALNALQHLSGIATYTAAQVQKLKGTHVRLYDTRKTLPGWRHLQKYAVHCGGAQNHRMSLGDVMMIKENHLRVARETTPDWVSRLRRLKGKNGLASIQMEVQTQRDFQEALRLKPQRVLLDNLSRQQLTRMTRVLRRQVPGIEIEITGGVKPEQLRRLARLGPDGISMGRLTHSVTAFDCSLEILRVYPN